tara:strand:+ start:7142 stop:7699 length:558 start_codon:yes stop_codon:yes gene_type:complete
MKEDVRLKITEELEQTQREYKRWVEGFGNSYQIQDHTISEWRSHFAIRLPADIGTDTCKSVDIKLVNLFQEAHGNKGKAEAALSMYKAGYAKRYRAEYASLVRSYEGKKLPAAGTLVTLTEEKLGDMKDAIALAETEVSFWREMLANLNTIRKIIENATLNISVEAKALNYQNMLDRMEQKGNNR